MPNSRNDRARAIFLFVTGAYRREVDGFLSCASAIGACLKQRRQLRSNEVAMNTIHRSIGFSAVDRYGSILFQVVSLAVLARLLTPEEFGIYTAIYGFLALGTVSSREFGGANYLIQKPGLTEESIRTAFTISLAMSCALALTLFVLRDIVAHFFSHEGLKIGIAFAALNLLLSPFVGTLAALLRRDMDFDVLARCNLTANLIAAAASITFAALGYSFMSPILGTLVGQSILTALLMRERRNLRIFLLRLEGWRDVIAFGVYSSAVSIINALYQMSPQLIMARVLDFTAVGLYGRAINITQMFDKMVIEVLNPVIMPAVVAQTRAGADLKPVYLRAVELVTAAQWPFLIFTAIMADPIVRILLGPAWHDAVPLVRLLCLASLSLFAACLTYPVLVAVGRVRDTLIASIISVPPSLLMVFIASFFGVRAVAAASLVTLPSQMLVALYFISRRLAIRPVDLLDAVRKSAIVTVVSASGTMVSVTMNGFDFAVPLMGFIGAGGCGLAGWLLGLVVTRHPLLIQMRLAGKDLVSLAPSVLGRLRAAGSEGKSSSVGEGKSSSVGLENDNGRRASQA